MKLSALEMKSSALEIGNVLEETQFLRHFHFIFWIFVYLTLSVEFQMSVQLFVCHVDSGDY